MPVTVRALLLADFSPTAAIGAGVTFNVDLPCGRGFDLYDCHVLATATVGGSSAALSRQALGAGAFVPCSSATIAMATDGTVTRQIAGMINAQRVLVATDVLRCSFVDGGAGGANGHMYANLLPNPITGAS